MDSAKWWTYGSVMVALGMSGDGGGVEVGKGLQWGKACWRITVLGVAVGLQDFGDLLLLRASVMLEGADPVCSC